MTILRTIELAEVVLLASGALLLVGWFIQLWKKDREEAQEILFFIYLIWMALGWVPALFLMMVTEVGFYLLIAYFVSWIVSVCVYESG